ncbi:MAG: glycerophosphodiester phosphodiesterase [Lachnospiraceae bacterium]|nr:glycerophosphodiester phosphodiesterase [Lachnospiraceae bacterium]
MQILLLLLIILLLLTAAYLFCLKPNTKRPQQMAPFAKTYIAHRGFFDNTSNRPENSLAAFQKAAELGYGIELDVQLTKDGKLVVFHDPSLERMCGINQSLSDFTFQELQKFTLADSSQTIPLLSDVLILVNGRVPLVIEIKPEGNCIETARQLSSLMEHYRGVYCIESFHPFVVAWFRKHQPHVLRGQLSTDYKKNHLKQTPIIRFLLTNLLLNWYGRPDFIAYNHRYASQPSYRVCRRLYPVVNAAWTIRSQAELDKAKSIFTIFIFDSFQP